MDLQTVMHPVLLGVVTLVLGLIGAAAAKFTQKLGLQVDAQKFFQQREVAQAIVLMIEEQFAAGKKAGWTPDVTKQAEGVIQLQSVFPKLTEDAAKNLIDEAVIRLGIGATANPPKPLVP